MRQGIHALVQLAVQASLICCCTVLAHGQTQTTVVLPNPGQTSTVVCASDPNQSYAAYLPSAYTVAKRWPIIYFFDPGGRGDRPVEMYKDLAERYGFIFVGSNNSKNFSGDQSQAVNAIWQDTHWRLSLDDHRVYASGFSGGARVAGAMALNSPGQIAGVIAHGAGYPNGRPTSGDKLLYYFAIGNQDFNWPEVVTAAHDREKQGLAYRIRQYSGKHQWAPPEIMDDAIQWLTLKAMQGQAVPPDQSFIDHQFDRLQKEAWDAEKKNDVLAEFEEYRNLTSDFTGLKDVSSPAAKLAALKQSAALKAALKNERSKISEQLRIERELSPKLRAYEEGSVPDLNMLRLEIEQTIAGLKEQANHAKSEERRLVLNRALDDMYVESIESGQQEFQARHLDKAESCFELMRQVTDDAWPVLLLAETHVAMGNKKQAIRDLREAIRRGLKDADVLESDKKLDSLRPDPEFQRLMSVMKSK